VAIHVLTTNHTVVVDLRGVGFIGSNGISVLSAINDELTTPSRMAIVPSSAVARLLQLYPRYRTCRSPAISAQRWQAWQARCGRRCDWLSRRPLFRCRPQDQNQDGMGLDGDRRSSFDRATVPGVVGGIDDRRLFRTEFRWRKGEFDRLVMGVEAPDNGVIGHPLAAYVAVRNALSVEIDGNRFAEPRISVFITHLRIIGSEAAGISAVSPT
jgi:hypothetical protein